MSLRQNALFVLALIVFLAFQTPCLANRQAKIPYFTPPVQNYAVLDISGTDSGPYGVYQVALNDANGAGYGFFTDPSSDFTTFKFVNGSTTHVQDVPQFTITVDGDTTTIQTLTGPYIVDSLGGLYADGTIGSYDPYPVPISGGYAIIRMDNGVETQLFAPLPYLSGISEDDLGNPFGDPGGQTDLSLLTASESGYGSAIDAALVPTITPTGAVYSDGYFIQSGSSVIFDPNVFSLGSPPPGEQVINSLFEPTSMNNTGSALGYLDGGDRALWNGSSIIDIPNAADLNDQDQVVVGLTEQTGSPQTEGSLWENGATTTLRSTLPFWFQWQVFNVQPFSISNQLLPAPLPPAAPSNNTDTTIHILSQGSSLVQGGQTNSQTMLWTRNNSGAWNYANVALPTGTSISDFTSINSSGVIAAMGNGGHALLLLPVQLYRDQDLTQVLDDWPAQGDELRSPKFILSGTDYIYIKLIGPQGMGNSAIRVTVTSDSDSTGITFPLAEISPGVYSNQGAVLPLRLDKATAEAADAYTIRTAGKEVVNFQINLNGTLSTGPNVMVLRGKFASCGIDLFYGGSNGDAAVVQTQAVTDAGFFEAGNQDYPDNVVAQGNPMEAFILAAGDGSDGQATWLHVSSHGDPAGDLGDASKANSFVYLGNTVSDNGVTYTHGETLLGGLIFQPSQIDPGINWNQDVEWVELASCDQLNAYGGGAGKWVTPFFSAGPRSIHGILGACGELSGDLQVQLTNFWTILRQGSTVIDAYEQGMDSSPAQPWALSWNDQNIGDTLKQITRDNPGDSTFTYQTTSDIVTDGRDVVAGEVPVVETIDGGNGLIRVSFPDTGGLRLHQTVQLSCPADLTKVKHPAFAAKVRTLAGGSQDFVGSGLAATLYHRTSLTIASATKMASDYLGRDFPEFAGRLKVKKVDQRVSGVLRRNDTRSSWISGFLAQYSVLVGDTPVWDNYVNVKIANDQVARVIFKVFPEQKASREMITPVEIRFGLAKALPAVKRLLGIESKYEILKAELVYVNRATVQGKAIDFATQFIPAWHLVINPAYTSEHSRKPLDHVWLDASSGAMIGAASE